MTLFPTSAHGSSAGIGAVLFDSTLSIAAASIDTGANGIAAGYSILEIFMLTRTDAAAGTSAVNVTFNNDTGANYDRMFVKSLNAAVSGGPTLAQTQFGLTALGNNSGANCLSVHRLTMPGYTQTTFFKELEGISASLDTGNVANCDVWALGLSYRSTTAISRMKVAGSGSNLMAGNRLLIYGR